jgi:hypothetical protein
MDFSVTSALGCDLYPVDLNHEQEAIRMRSFIWVDHEWRLAQLDYAINILKSNPVSIEKADAGDWIREKLLNDESKDGCRVLIHSVVWQYLSQETRSKISSVMEKVGKTATPERPLAWVAVETNRHTSNHQLTVKYWGGHKHDGRPIVLGESHTHGMWMRWLHEQ